MNNQFINLFKRNYQKYSGIRLISLYVLKLFFAMMFFMMGGTAWTELINNSENWELMESVTWCMWVAYATLSGIGIYNTLKMLPIFLFMIFYKILWLLIVAYPLWKTGNLMDSPFEETTYIFLMALIPLLFFPWMYFFNNYIKPTTIE